MGLEQSKELSPNKYMNDGYHLFNSCNAHQTKNNFSGLFITAYYGGNNHTPILITASKLDVWNMDMVTQERRQRLIDHGYLNGGSGHGNSSRSIE